MWRSYKQFWQHQQSTKVHYFTDKTVAYGGHRLTLCGRAADIDYISDREPRPDLPARFYCKRCQALLAKQQG